MSRPLGDYFRKVQKRLHDGEAEYGGKSFTTTDQLKLYDELMEELEDIPGWAFILWYRVKQAKAAYERSLRES